MEKYTDHTHIHLDKNSYIERNTFGKQLEDDRKHSIQVRQIAGVEWAHPEFLGLFPFLDAQMLYIILYIYIV